MFNFINYIYCFFIYFIIYFLFIIFIIFIIIIYFLFLSSLFFICVLGVGPPSQWPGGLSGHRAVRVRVRVRA